MPYETFRLLAFSDWLTLDFGPYSDSDRFEIEWANECVAAGLVFA